MEWGICEFDLLVVWDFKVKGLMYVCICVVGVLMEVCFIYLCKLVEVCEYYGVIFIIVYQVDVYKIDFSVSYEKELINWWSVVVCYFGQIFLFLGFDFIYEFVDKFNYNMVLLNCVYDKIICLIYVIDLQWMIFVVFCMCVVLEDLLVFKLLV